MICYRNMTFCADSMADAKAPCVEKRCYRRFSTELAAARRRWLHDPDKTPIAFKHFAETCPGYRNGDVQQ